MGAYDGAIVACCLQAANKILRSCFSVSLFPRRQGWWRKPMFFNPPSPSLRLVQSSFLLLSIQICHPSSGGLFSGQNLLNSPKKKAVRNDSEPMTTTLYRLGYWYRWRWRGRWRWLVPWIGHLYVYTTGEGGEKKGERWSLFRLSYLWL